MFLILGILIVLFMVTIKIAIEPARKITRPGEFDSINIRNEFSSVQKYTQVNHTNLTQNMDNFSEFMIERLSQRKIDFGVVWVNGYIESIDDRKINITLGNYLGATMSYVNISFGNATKEQFSYVLNNLAHNTYNITIVPFVNLVEEKHINVTYTVNGVNTTLFFTFIPIANFTTITTLYDLKYSILDKTTKDQFIQSDHR